jgi:hypothetical protein
MPIAQMATPPIAESPEPGVPVPRDSIDPELVKLPRARPRIGVITAAAVVGLSLYFIVGIGPDRRFAGEPEPARVVALADVAAGKVPDNTFVAFDADPMVSHAIRAARSKGDSGYRVAPVRGTGERVWLALPGDGWEKPVLKRYSGRLRRIGDLPFARVLDAHATAHPRPAFATAANLRAGFATGQVTTVAGDQIAVDDTDRVAFDVVDPGRAIIIASFTGKRDPAPGDPGHGPLTDAGLWIAELARHGITATPSAAPGQADAVLGQVRLDVAQPVDDVTGTLEAAKLWAARVERVPQHLETTWGELRRSTADGLLAGGRAIPDAHVDLIGLFVRRGVSDDALALVTDERPSDHWAALPRTIALAAVGLLFAWVLVRAIRSLLPTRVALPERSPSSTA